MIKPARAIRRHAVSTCAVMLLAGCGKEANEAATEPDLQVMPTTSGPLVVYATHGAANAAAMLDAYKAETGTRFRLMTDEYPNLDARLKNPDFFPQADLFLSASLAELWAVAEADQLRPVSSAVIDGNVAAELRDTESRFVGLAKRARIVVYNTGRVAEDEMSTVERYASLGEDAWRGKLCISSSKVSGNRSLIAFLIRRHDVREAELIVRRWLQNLVLPVFADDALLLQALADGDCAIAIADSNELARLTANPDVALAARWFDTPGATFIDVSGAGVTRHAHDPDGALRLLEWLTTAAPNALYATQNMEFPVNPNAPAGLAIAAWSGYVTDPLPLSDLGFLQDEAVRLIERAGYP